MVEVFPLFNKTVFLLKSIQNKKIYSGPPAGQIPLKQGQSILIYCNMGNLVCVGGTFLRKDLWIIHHEFLAQDNYYLINPQ